MLQTKPLFLNEKEELEAMTEKEGSPQSFLAGKLHGTKAAFNTA